MRRIALLAILAACLSQSALLPAGEVGSTLGKYSVAGAGVGALLGSAAATLPYLQSKEPYDFLTGAGIGLLAGSTVGFILGIVDLAHPAQTAALGPPEGLQLAWTPAAVEARWTVNF